MTSLVSRQQPLSGSNPDEMNGSLPFIGLGAPSGLSAKELDTFWMRQAMQLALSAEGCGEVPVGAVVVQNDICIGIGSNSVIADHDPSAHAEVMAMRSAGRYLKNYRLTGATLYVTLEPCPMCAGAMVHARLGRLVYGADDVRTGSAGSVFNLVQSDYLNHQLDSVGQVLSVENADLIRNFFLQKRR